MPQNFMYFLVMHQHMYAASREEKDSFFAILREAISSLSQGDCFVLLGDFNERVGSRQAADEWWNERGPMDMENLMVQEESFWLL